MGLIKKLGIGGACLLGTLALCGPALAAPATLYVSNYTLSGGVTEFPIGAGGELQSDVVAATADAPTWYEAVTPNGKYLYASSNISPDGTVDQYRIGADGALTALSPATVSAGAYPTGITVSPDGEHVYVAENSSDAVAIFDVGSNGALTPNATQAMETTGLSGPYAVAFSRDGKSLYVPNDLGTTVAEFNVAADGTLTPKSTASVAAGTHPDYVVITPDGRYAYAPNYIDASISEYKIGAGGQLVANGTITGVGAGADNLYSAAVSPDGKSLYAANATAIHQYTIGSTGRLTAKSPATVTTGPGAENLWFTADGRSAYSANDHSPTDGSVSEWNVAANGDLSAKSTPTVTSVPGASAVMIAPDQGPVASLADAPAPPGSPFHFNASSSHDPDGSVAMYSWRFGDGKSAQTSVPTVAHTYAHPGHYTTTLTVTGDEGCSASFVFTGGTAYCNGGPAAINRRTISVPAIKPTASTGSATNVGRQTAMLRGSLNPHGAATTFHFQYGTSTGYGSATAAKNAGSGLTAKPASAALSGLKPGKTYHYRLVASNSAGTVHGADHTFKTEAKNSSSDGFTG